MGLVIYVMSCVSGSKHWPTLLASGVSPPNHTAGVGFLYVYIDVSDDEFWPPGLPAHYA